MWLTGDQAAEILDLWSSMLRLSSIEKLFELSVLDSDHSSCCACVRPIFLKRERSELMCTNRSTSCEKIKAIELDENFSWIFTAIFLSEILHGTGSYGMQH